MAATTGQLGLVTPTQGDLSGVWGDTVNNGITEYTNIAIAGTLTLTGDGAVTLQNTTGNNSASNITSTLTGAGTVTAQFAIVKVTGTLTTAKIITGPSYSKTYLVVNAATGSTVSFIRSGQTPAVSIAVGESAFVYFNGTDYVKLVGTATAGAAGGSNTQVQYNNSGVLAGITGATTNGTALTLVAPVLGTPASATLTNATGLPISTGVSGLGAGVATFLATPSSANLATAVTDETGSGALVFATSPTLITPALGTPSSGTVTNLTGTASININGTVGATTPTTGAFTTVTENGYAVVSQADIGTADNEIPLNQYLGSMAYQNGTDYYNVGMTVGFRNRIINGAMMIDQRNSGSSVSVTDSNQYTLDRWQGVASLSSSKFTVQQSSTAPSGFSNSLLATSSSAYSVLSSDYFLIRQKIEGFNTSDLAWGTSSAKSVTISFWVYSSLTGSFGGSVTNSANSYSYPFSYTINSANTWEQKTISISGPTAGTWIGATNGIGLQLKLSLGAGSTYSGTAGAWASADLIQPTGSTSLVGTSGATFYITGIQLEVGAQATPFDFRSIGTELALCQRYFEKDVPQGITPQQGLGSTNQSYGGGLTAYLTTDARTSRIRFAVTKRAAPTITFYRSDAAQGGTVDGQWSIYIPAGWTTATSTTLTDGVAFDNEFAVNLIYTAYTVGSSYLWGGTWTASAEL